MEILQELIMSVQAALDQVRALTPPPVTTVVEATATERQQKRQARLRKQEESERAGFERLQTLMALRLAAAQAALQLADTLLDPEVQPPDQHAQATPLIEAIHAWRSAELGWFDDTIIKKRQAQPVLDNMGQQRVTEHGLPMYDIVPVEHGPYRNYRWQQGDTRGNYYIGRVPGLPQIEQEQPWRTLQRHWHPITSAAQVASPTPMAAPSSLLREIPENARNLLAGPAQLRVIAQSREAAAGAVAHLQQHLGDTLQVLRPPQAGRKGEWLAYLELGSGTATGTPEEPTIFEVLDQLAAVRQGLRDASTAVSRRDRIGLRAGQRGCALVEEALGILDRVMPALAVAEERARPHRDEAHLQQQLTAVVRLARDNPRRRDLAARLAHVRHQLEAARGLDAYNATELRKLLRDADDELRIAGQLRERIAELTRRGIALDEQPLTPAPEER